MARVTPPDRPAAVHDTQLNKSGGGRTHNPADGLPRTVRAARATVPGRPSLSGPLEGEGGKTSAAALDLALGSVADHIPAGGGPSQSPLPAGSNSSMEADGAVPGGDARPGRGDPGFTPPRPGQDARSWTLELPPGLPLLSLNDRLHYQERNRRAQVIKEAAWAMALHGKIPQLARALIAVEYQPPDRRHRDADNPVASAKAAVDGIVLAGVLEDDECPRYVTGIYCTIGERYPKGRLVLTVTEVAA